MTVFSLWFVGFDVDQVLPPGLDGRAGLGTRAISMRGDGGSISVWDDGLVI
ncbi:hypothetical protein [Burkholderia sp. 22PA0106]|uniref:hypothetical protein n=1 Tax=Burkholderia sp. 22PA0106 TaxID=3237371 RepID=UPI0039C2905B